MLMYLIALAAVALALSCRRPAPQQMLVTIEPMQPAGSGCAPLLLVVLAVVLIILLTPS